jgi:NAD(P)-dependent dehydrogenase (short-subunit alcohol dehydrogenase family)
MLRILVTGANKGIGFAIAERILEEADDTFLFLGSRDRARGEAAAERLRQGGPNRADRVEVVEIDVVSDESVERAAERVREACGSDELFAIVNNAGAGIWSDDLEHVLDVNTRGIHRVCTALIPLLGDGGRIVNVTSAAGPNFVAKCSTEKRRFFTRPDVSWSEIDALMNECVSLGGDEAAFAARGLSDGRPYGLSKACANAYTIHLAREHPRLVVNACTPGLIATDLTLPHEKDRGRRPEELGMKSPREGATSAIFLLFGAPDGSGHYYGSDAERSPMDRYRAPGTPPYTGD